MSMESDEFRSCGLKDAFPIETSRENVFISALMLTAVQAWSVMCGNSITKSKEGIVWD
jgi:hypothetical protein